MKKRRILGYFLSEKFFPLFFTCLFFYNKFNSRKTSKFFQKKALNSLNFKDFKAKRNSDILYVLGSGGSINKLTTKHWKIISNSDSIGLNFWPIHEFVPTFYCFEVPREKDRREILINLLSLRSYDYKNVPIILKDFETFLKISKRFKLDVEQFLQFLPFDLKRQLFFSVDFSIPDYNFLSVKKSIRVLNKLNYFKKGQAIVKCKASLSYIISFAIKMGYKKVVFCGVDLNNNKYFYDSKEFDFLRDKGLIPQKKDGQIHKTNIKKGEFVTIIDVMKIYREEILKNFGIDIEVAFSSSALYPEFKNHFKS